MFKFPKNKNQNSKSYAEDYLNVLSKVSKKINFNLVNDLSMSANTLADIIPGGSLLHLNAGDKLVCHMESGATFDVTTSVEEHYEPHKSS